MVNTTPHLPPGKETRYPFDRRFCETDDRSGQAENLAPSGFDSRNVQLVVSRYADCVLTSHVYQDMQNLLFEFLALNLESERLLRIVDNYQATKVSYVQSLVDVMLRQPYLIRLSVMVDKCIALVEPARSEYLTTVLLQYSAI